MSFATFKSSKFVKGRLQAALYSMRKKKRRSREVIPQEKISRIGNSSFSWCTEGSTENPIQTAPIQTSKDSLLFYFYGGYTSNNNSPVDSSGLSLTLIASQFYTPYGTGFQNRLYSADSITVAVNPSHSCSFTKNDYVSGEVSLCLIEVLNCNTLENISVTYVEPGTTVTSGNVNISKPGVILAAWFGDGGDQNHSAVPDGFTVLESLLELPSSLGVQCCFAYKEVDTAGDFNATWNVSPAQGGALYVLSLTWVEP